jgi:hypothetical protein
MFYGRNDIIFSDYIYVDYNGDIMRFGMSTMRPFKRLGRNKQVGACTIQELINLLHEASKETPHGYKAKVCFHAVPDPADYSPVRGYHEFYGKILLS